MLKVAEHPCISVFGGVLGQRRAFAGSSLCSRRQVSAVCYGCLPRWVCNVKRPGVRAGAGAGEGEQAQACAKAGECRGESIQGQARAGTNACRDGACWVAGWRVQGGACSGGLCMGDAREAARVGAANAGAARAGAAHAGAARAGGRGQARVARAGAGRRGQTRPGAAGQLPGRARARASACPGKCMPRHTPYKYSRRVSRNARRANLMGLWDSGAMEAKKKVPSLKLPLQHRQARGRSGALVGRAATSLRSIETHPCGRLVRPLLEGHRPALLLGR